VGDGDWKPSSQIAEYSLTAQRTASGCTTILAGLHSECSSRAEHPVVADVDWHPPSAGVSSRNSGRQPPGGPFFASVPGRPVEPAGGHGTNGDDAHQDAQRAAA
jgi:hypothetical protein